MADGLNQARAMRVAEIMNDFRSLQYHLAAIPISNDRSESQLEGQRVLQACIAEGQAVLASEFTQQFTSPHGDQEAVKQQLIDIIADAAVRRFRAHRAYMRAVAAHRWILARTQVLESGALDTQVTAQLQRLDEQLRTTLSAVTDAHVEETLRAHDTAQGKYLNDDPALQEILECLEDIT